MKPCKIAGRTVGPSFPAYIIAEIGLAHDGSLGIAHSYIDALAATGVDAIKFQVHIAEAESSTSEVFRVPFSYEDATRFDYWKRTSFDMDHWKGIAAHCAEAGVTFLATPFSPEAVDLLEELEAPAFKIGSGDLLNRSILDRVLATGKPVLLSTGMASWEEIENAVTLCQNAGSPVVLFQCTSEYPVAPENVGLNVISEMRERFGAPAGLSDHSGDTLVALAAMAQGADIIEAHAVFDKRMFGPDAKASLTIDDFSAIVSARDTLFAMRTPVDKDATSRRLAHMRSLFGRSVCVTADLPAGTKIKAEHLTLKKPSGGIPPEQLHKLVGRTLVRDIRAIDLLSWQDLEEK
ncbi:N-acetylneuraminate synthase [Oceanidesulfovibrio indonesiensis]|uniref:N-acetylneuraminate synthase n=1 Tax=Oceanidesulfovibrio indonesiensis TaxID=54767 RepID=A0A7M3M9W1_9BACT|nr:N-acetylneuraminate synthase family protein [Oceanidesulfovibrio indonesiensis]TVM13814.1 N-acetylneuraminate synthase [Oceanidesulfovibrio indonesiensis]